MKKFGQLFCRFVCEPSSPPPLNEPSTPRFGGKRVRCVALLSICFRLLSKYCVENKRFSKNNTLKIYLPLPACILLLLIIKMKPSSANLILATFALCFVACVKPEVSFEPVLYWRIDRSFRMSEAVRFVEMLPNDRRSGSRKWLRNYDYCWLFPKFVMIEKCWS